MADNVSVKVTGIPEAIEKLKKYQFIKRDAIIRVLKETGFKIEADAKTGPVPVLTGRLRASISTNWSGSPMPRGKTGSLAGHDDGVGRPTGPKGLSVAVGSNVAYAKLQEFGYWGDAPKLGKGEYISQKGRPKRKGGKRPSGGWQFLSKAYYKNEGEALSRIKKVMKQK